MKDYYLILGISVDATERQIKSAYHNMAVLWHPDKNPNRDTTEKMKEINEAYAILSNPESRLRYDREYSFFKYNHTSNNKEDSDDYEIKDEALKRDVYNARMSAEEFVKHFYSNFKKDTDLAAKGAWEAAKPYLISFAIICAIGIIIGLISLP